jgi:hypothetical protein
LGVSLRIVPERLPPKEAILVAKAKSGWGVFTNRVLVALVFLLTVVGEGEILAIDPQHIANANVTAASARNCPRPSGRCGAFADGATR